MSEPVKYKKTAEGIEYEYAIYPLVPNDSEVLHQQTPEFDFANPPIDPKFLAISMLETMVKNYGVGLAAPQIGLPYRVFVMGSPDGNGFACFNPKIISAEGETAFEEGCLSWKGLFLMIKRPETINVQYQDFSGALRESKFQGLTSRTFQHELDHLNGVVYISLVNRYTLDKAKGKVKTNLKKLEKQRIQQAKNFAIQKAMAKVAAERQAQELQKQINLSIPDVTIELPSVTITTPTVIEETSAS